MLILDIIYVFLTAIGILGVGHWVWSRIKQEALLSSGQGSGENFTENIFLTASISWFFGYFSYEGILQLLSISHLFQPLTVLLTGVALSLAGWSWILANRNLIQKQFKKPIAPLWELVLLTGMAGFIYFWNFYPSFDVDSLAFYFPSIQQTLEHGGRHFSRFADVRFNVPMGENLMYSLGFALHLHSTFIPQLIQGLSKVMLFLGVYGAARSLGAGSFALIAGAFVLSEEHFIASGTNHNVHINPILAGSIFLVGLALFIFFAEKQKEYLYLAIIAAFDAMTCKYLGLGYLGAVIGIIILSLFFRRETRESLKFSFKKQPLTICFLFGAAVFGTLPYIANIFITGTPIFPAVIGPFKSWCYDNAVSELGKRWHYHLSIAEAMKNYSAFMVWPGVLASKVLFPLTMGAGIVAMLSTKKNHRLFNTGLCFVVISIFVVLLQQIYMVFEMRYYRFGIGQYALAATFLLLYVVRSFLDEIKFLQKSEKLLSALFILIICAYCVRYSFDVMGQSRASAKDIVAFLSNEKSESQIITERFPEFQDGYNAVEKLNINPNQLGYFLSYDWGHTFYPVAGKNIRFLHSAAFPSTAYFNEGLFAQALRQEGIKYIFNQEATQADYPVFGGAVNNVFKQCGHPLDKTREDLIELSETCLDKLAAKKDAPDGEQRLQRALEENRAYPVYQPFVPPSYGGSNKIIK